MKIIERSLAVPASDVSKYTKLMQAKTVDYRDLQLPKFSTVESWTVDFGEGYEMDLKVCSSADGDPLWSEIVLFLHGSECGCSDVEDRLLGDWDMTDETPNGHRRFILHVVEDCEV